MTKTVRAHANIALIKYWGKDDEVNRIPSNSSLSLTLDAFYTDTKVTYQKDLKEDIFYLDGKEVSALDKKRVTQFMDYVRNRYDIHDYALIESFNHVPTAAGLASSASAFAALAKAATLHLNLDDVELSKLARYGSGSASRSIYGGFSIWHKGSSDASSYATAIEMDPWDDIVMIACILNESKKPFSSSEAMYKTSSESVYFEAWVKQSEKDIVAMTQHVKAHDIKQVGQLAQENALRMHASLLAVNRWYFEPETIRIMNLIRDLQKDIPVYFTMDAGPNVKLITTKPYVETVLSHLKDIKTITATQGKGTYVL